MDTNAPPSPLAHLDHAATAFLQRIAASARDYLNAHVSFVAEVAEAEVVRATAGPAAAAGLPVGARFELEDTYCHRVLQGRLPEVIYDARVDVRTRDIPLTERLGIESYMGVPVTLRDGRVLGTLCCINFPPEPDHRARDLGFMHFLAALVGDELGESLRAHDLRMQRHEAVHAVLRAGGPRMVMQPIVPLDGGRAIGAEALARFDLPVHATPDVWFHEAHAVGLGIDLELASVRNALPLLQRLPRDTFLSLNASPDTVAHADFADAIARVDPSRLVIEITEHAAVDDYLPVIDAATRLRNAGVRIAIDDVGAGYSSLRHVLQLAPDIAKLDMSLTRDVDRDPAKQALVAGMMAFAMRTGVAVVAEGVETAMEAQALREAGVRFAQGFAFGAPGNALH
ncbi:EAL domain-containing protein [Lysobacter sp. TY2-98]|uniref:sensor domain-containing phosphodiesterase n=1 Tax=Lysobacter sp. TY2-98 TaxID=2290922 RepID=UPI000E1FEFCA|nr:EAL domain-containing protein [Lysobacter sp. TY2-98]AXK73428.1 EAL domain-containing protein [Lysobacter sp. TY2-98]